MPGSVASRLDGVQRKMLSVRGEALGKNLSDAAGIADADRAYGQILKRTCEIGGFTPQSIAYALGHQASYEAHISSWFVGREKAPIARLLKLPGFRPAYITAQAEAADSGIEVRTIVTLERRRA